MGSPTSETVGHGVVAVLKENAFQEGVAFVLTAKGPEPLK